MDFKQMFVTSVTDARDNAAAAAEFRKLIAGPGGKVTIPDDPDEKREWFRVIVWKAAEAGKNLKTIITLIAGLKYPNGSAIGTKLAGTIVRHAVEAKRAAVIAEKIPGIEKLEETDRKRALTAFWKMEETVKLSGEKVPLCVVVSFKDSITQFKAGMALGKAMHKTEGTAEQVAAMNEACKKLQENTDELKALRATVKSTVSKFFHVEEHAGRGRGANIYTSISSELSFMDEN